MTDSDAPVTVDHTNDLLKTSFHPAADDSAAVLRAPHHVKRALKRDVAFERSVTPTVIIIQLQDD